MVIGGISLNLLILERRDSNKDNSFLGGPYLANLAEAVSSEADSILADNVFDGEFEIASDSDATAGFVIIDGDSVLNASNHLSTILPTRDGLLVYKVQKGDTLQKISSQPEIYGTSKKWMKIYEANKDKLKSPDKIRPGQELKIPRD